MAKYIVKRICTWEYTAEVEFEDENLVDYELARTAIREFGYTSPNPTLLEDGYKVIRKD